LIFLACVVWVNPIREAPIDDDWAYALTVKNLIDTGAYVLHPWAAANFPFQAFWGVIFTWFLGYSFSILRISTLVLTYVGLISTYLFARDLKINRNAAGLLVLILSACPLFLRFSLSFMTDIPFVSLLVLSTFLYWRTFLRNSLLYALLASVSCSAAILTRQLGVALLGAVIIYGVVYFRRKLTLRLVMAGLILPTIALIWQLHAAFIAPNWGMLMVKEAQKLYMLDPNGLFVNLLIRPAYILIYLAFFCSPLLIVCLRRKFTPGIFFIVSGYVFSSLIIISHNFLIFFDS